MIEAARRRSSINIRSAASWAEPAGRRSTHAGCTLMIRVAAVLQHAGHATRGERTDGFPQHRLRADQDRRSAHPQSAIVQQQIRIFPTSRRRAIRHTRCMTSPLQPTCRPHPARLIIASVAACGARSCAEVTRSAAGTLDIARPGWKIGCWRLPSTSRSASTPTR